MHELFHAGHHERCFQVEQLHDIGVELLVVLLETDEVRLLADLTKFDVIECLAWSVFSASLLTALDYFQDVVEFVQFELESLKGELEQIG